MRACGLDFGTSNSTLGVVQGGLPRLIALEGGAQTLPSAVFWPDDGAPSFGRAAIGDYVAGEGGRLMRGLKSTLGTPLMAERTRLGGRAVALREVLARYIGHLAAQLATEGPLPEAVVMGRPVHFVDDDAAADAEAEAMLGEIAREVGFSHVAFQHEPIAAALHYETGLAAEELVLIVDIGGGTSDVSLVRLGPARAGRADRAADILGNDGIRLGGTDFDRLLSLAEALPYLGFGAATRGGSGVMPRHYFLDLATWHRINALYTRPVMTDLKALRHQAERPELIDRLIAVIDGRLGHALAMEVERVKIALTGAEAARLMLGAICQAPNPMIGRAALDAALAPALLRIADLVARVLAQGGVSAGQIGSVFLTGGSSQMPALHAMVAAALPDARIATGDMLGSVGTGLALDAARRFA